jgi:hypothetical protein
MKVNIFRTNEKLLKVTQVSKDEKETRNKKLREGGSGTFGFFTPHKT